MITIIISILIIIECFVTLLFFAEFVDEDTPFYPIIHAWETLEEEEINVVGRIIAIIPVTILALPSIIIAYFGLFLLHAITFMCKAYKFIFRKRS